MKFLIVALFLAVASLPSCEDAGEAVDNFDSKQACQDYCAKKDDCKDEQSSADQVSACVSTCRNDIEDNCVNEHQGAANDQIGTCVDKGCVEFWACMTFDVAPECYGFVEP
jgi:hypothetical protein